MIYSVPDEKITLLKSLISVICKLYMDNMYIVCTGISEVIGYGAGKNDVYVEVPR